MFLFGNILINQFGNIISWDFMDYILFTLLANFIMNLSGLFWFGKSLKFQIFKLKKFNSYLYLPGNRFFNYIFSIYSNFTLFSLIELISIIFLLFSIHFTPKFGILILITSILLIILYITVTHFCLSVSWISLEVGENLGNIITTLDFHGARRFPGDFINNFSFHFLFFLVPAYFIATLLIPLANGIIPNYFTQYLLIIIGIIIVSSIGIYINWSYGLKSYEGWE